MSDAKKVAQLGTELLLQSLDSQEIDPSQLCDVWFCIGKTITHDPVTEDGEVFYCAHCGAKLRSKSIIQ